MIDVLEQAVEHALAGVPNRRRERVFAVAEAYRRLGLQLPGSAEMRQIVGRGSLTDITRDLREARSVILDRVEKQIGVPEIPPELELQFLDGLQQVWALAADLGKANYDHQRSADEERVAVLAAELDRANAERLQAVRERDTTALQVAELERLVVTRDKQISALGDQIEGGRQSVNNLTERIGQLDLELDRERADRCRLEDMLREKDNRIVDLQAVAGTLRAGYEERLTGAHQLETEHRRRADDAADEISRYQEWISGLEKDLAEARTHAAVSATRVTHAEQARDADVARIAVLQHQLSEANRQIKEAAEERARLERQLAVLRGAL